VNVDHRTETFSGCSTDIDQGETQELPQKREQAPFYHFCNQGPQEYRNYGKPEYEQQYLPLYCPVMTRNRDF
jgi:hypothetical protein